MIELTIELDTVSYIFATVNVNINQIPIFSNQELGICWDTVANPTIEKNKITIQEIKEPTFKNTTNTLKSNTTYYLRGYLKIDENVIYSNQKEFTTLDAKPLITKTDIQEIMAISAKIVVTAAAPQGFEITK